MKSATHLCEFEEEAHMIHPADYLPTPAAFTVEEVMTERPLVSVFPDTSLSTTVELMLARNVSGLPVVDETGKLVGVVSKTDLLREGASDAVEGELSLRTVSEVMTTQVLTITRSANIAEAARLLIRSGLHRAPVVSDTGNLEGMLSTTDLVRWLAGIP
jgi:CBS domain-containing protein